MRAWTAYRDRLVAEHGEAWAGPSTPAFVGIDRWGRVTGGMVPDSVTRAVKRISQRAGVPLHWTGHSLRIGLASTARKRGRDGIAIADQGGWARHSRSMLGYMQREDGWDDKPPPDSPDGAPTPTPCCIPPGQPLPPTGLSCFRGTGGATPGPA
ncbi:hypothetical protein [Streptomyces sp. NPDC005131]